MGLLRSARSSSLVSASQVAAAVQNVGRIGYDKPHRLAGEPTGIALDGNGAWSVRYQAKQSHGRRDTGLPTRNRCAGSALQYRKETSNAKTFSGQRELQLDPARATAIDLHLIVADTAIGAVQ
jgi:hypothetical protein